MPSSPTSERRRAPTLLETVLSHVEDGVALLDANRTVLLANQSFAGMIGLTPAEAQGLTRERFFALLLPLLKDAVAFQDELFMPSARPVSRELVFTSPRRILRRSWTPIRLADGEGFLVTWHDVTAEQDLQREREQRPLIDALTGIQNRHAAEGALRKEQERMNRAGTPFSVALFDIDHLKQVNDRLGHTIGDEVLKTVASTLVAQGRLNDTIARWEGEEFIAVLDVALVGARIFCERARQAVEKLRHWPVGRISVSVGLAQVGPRESIGEALGRADRHLSEAKAGGRNRVCPAA